MEVNKISNKSNNPGVVNKESESDSYIKLLDRDVLNITLALQGRLRLGGGSDGEDGENLSGQFQSFTSHTTANTEFTVAHSMGSIPIGYLPLYQTGAGILYQGPSTGTSWTSTNVYLKSSASSVDYLIFLLK